MAESNKRPASHTNIVWRRLATPREAMFGIRTDGAIRSTCSKIEIISTVEIDQAVLEGCAEHFNRDMGCFHEFLMEKKESKDIWLVKLKENNYLVEELEKEIEIDERTMGKEINCQLRAEDTPKWKLYCTYVGHKPSLWAASKIYPHIYQLIFVFSTGTLDEFSCALICNLFLNILDRALNDARLQFYSDLKLYDIGSQMERCINRVINLIVVDDKSHYKKEDISYRNMLRSSCSSFDFTKREIENNNTKFRTINCLFSNEITNEFLNICAKKNIGISSAFITIINNVLFRHAVKNNFKGMFYTKVLHMVNARYLLNIVNEEYTYKLGSHFLPYMQYFKLDPTEVEDLLKQAPEVERKLNEFIREGKVWNQEALRELYIKEREDKYNTGEWNPHYCFSVTNLGNLDEFFESPKSSIRVLSYERASSAIEGGHLDIIIQIFRNKLAVHFDFSREYFSDNEMLSIINLFSDLVKTTVCKI